MGLSLPVCPGRMFRVVVARLLKECFAKCATVEGVEFGEVVESVRLRARDFSTQHRQLLFELRREHAR